jgi:hypothetical protein
MLRAKFKEFLGLGVSEDFRTISEKEFADFLDQEERAWEMQARQSLEAWKRGFINELEVLIEKLGGGCCEG